MGDSLNGLNSIIMFPANAPDRVWPDWNKSLKDVFEFSSKIFGLPGTKQQLLEWEKFIPKKMNLTFVSLGKTEEKNLIDFFVDRAGRHKNFWIPSFKSDFILDVDVSDVDSSIVIKDNKFDMVYGGYERIFIQMYNKDLITRQVTSIQSDPINKQTTLLLGSTLGRNIYTGNDPLKPQNYNIIGLLYLVRFDTDLININYLNNNVSEITFTFTELVKEYP